MRFHHAIAALLILVVCLVYALFLADQVTRIGLVHALGVPLGERRP